MRAPSVWCHATSAKARQDAQALPGSSPMTFLLASAPSWVVQAAATTAKAGALMALFCAVALSTAGSALAARSAGRVGGGSFSGYSGARSTSRSFAPSPSRSMGHSTTYVSSSVGVGLPSVSVRVRPIGHGHGDQHHGSSGMSPFVEIAMYTPFLACFALEAFNHWQEHSSRPSGNKSGREYPSVTVARLQVGLLAVAKEIKADLNQLAETADTSSPQGLHLLLQETVIALLRNPSYCAYASSSRQVASNPEEAERIFNKLSIEERQKVQEETLSNYGGRRRKSTRAKPADSEGPAELVVVNLLVAVKGKLDLPTIRTQSDLKIAMSALGAITPTKLTAVEVFWSPQQEDDVLSQTEALAKYPALVPL